MYVCRCAMDCLGWSGRIGREQLYAYCRQYHWNGVDRKSIVKLCAHYWQQVPHERHVRLYIPIRNWIWVRIWIWIWIQGSAMSADICFVREKIIHKKLSYCCMVYICICTYIPRWNQLSSRREIALRMDCQALTCWMLMNGTCVVALISRTWTWMRAIEYRNRKKYLGIRYIFNYFISVNFSNLPIFTFELIMRPLLLWSSYRIILSFQLDWVLIAKTANTETIR